MAKVTVYLTDDQMEQLKVVKNAGRGGVSKLFQTFLESAIGGGSGDRANRYAYARSLMPKLTAIEHHARLLARKVQAGGPPADGGPVAIALTILLYRELLERDPSVAAAIDKEFARFGLDDLVATETDGVDLTTPPKVDDDAETDDDGDFSWEQSFGGLGGLGGLGSLGSIGDLGGLGMRIGDEVREAMKHVGIFREGLRDLTGDRDDFVRAERVRRRPTRALVVEVEASDDPRDVLSVTDFATFTTRHPDWDAGTRLTPSQIETVRELLIRRAGGDPEVDEDAPMGVDEDEIDDTVDSGTTGEGTAGDTPER